MPWSARTESNKTPLPGCLPIAVGEADALRSPKAALHLRLFLAVSSLTEVTNPTTAISLIRTPGDVHLLPVIVWCAAQGAHLYPCAVDTSTRCPFCALPPERVLARDGLALAFRDAYPVSPGHTLVIPVRHVASFFDITPNERAAMFALLEAAKQRLHAEFSPAGYNIGINDGAAAGQTVGHLHIHLIPRYTGDQRDPRGGVRWVIPEKADYWTGQA